MLSTAKRRRASITLRQALLLLWRRKPRLSLKCSVSRGVAPKLSTDPDKPDMPATYLYDISKAKRDFNYETKYPLKSMLIDMKREMKLKRFPHLIAREIKEREIIGA